MTDYLILEYKGRRFTLSEFIEDQNNFAESLLQFPVIKKGQISVVSAEGENQVSFSIAITKCNQLYHAGGSARAALIQSYTKLFKSPIEWRGGYIGQLYYRSEFLKNAILSYNIVIDYLLQIIWFSFNFCDEDKMINKENYSAELRRCSKLNVKTKAKKIDNLKSRDFLEKFLKNLYGNKDVDQLIKWSHNLKHHANIKIKGLQQDLSYNITFPSGIKLSDYIGEDIDLDEADKVLKNVNNHLVSLSELLFSWIEERL